MNKWVLSCVCSVWLLFSAVSNVWCQQEGYFLGPRDILSISIHAGGVEQEKVEVTISEQGRINVPFIGSVTASGKTVSELEKVILKPLERDFFVSPQVNIQIKGYHSIRFFISGAVEKPGQYEMTSATNFLELVARAEGVLPERGSLAYVLRENHDDVELTNESVEAAVESRETIKVDLTKLLDEGKMSHNIQLVPGDIVYIPHASKLDQAVSKIYVEGEVKKPGVYEYQPGMTAMAACILAGGFDKYAAIARTKIIRTKENKEQEIIKIDLKKVTNGEIPDISIYPGDRIHVPETWL